MVHGWRLLGKGMYLAFSYFGLVLRLGVAVQGFNVQLPKIQRLKIQFLPIMNTILPQKAGQLLFIVFLLIHCTAQAQKDSVIFLTPSLSFDSTQRPFSVTYSIGYTFPYLEEVVQKFVEEYGFESAEHFLYGIEKRKEGYFVTHAAIEDYTKIISRELFWSATDHQYYPLSLPKQVGASGTIAQLTRDAYYYDRIPYYGYAGWYRDVIQDFSALNNKRDDMLLALGTAWYQRATALLSDLHHVADSLETFILPDSKNALNPEQLETYLQYMGKSLEFFEALAKQAPDYETIVGPATVKLADQYMTAFMQLHYFQNEKTALQILDRPALTYNEFLLESSRNLLQSCPKNAILLTYGDNDTYPLWYVQAKQGFRRDVVVANLSLIATGRYINHLRDSIFDAPPLHYQLSPAFYFNDSSLYMAVGEKNFFYGADYFDCFASKVKMQWRNSNHYSCRAEGLFVYLDKKGRPIALEAKATDKKRKIEISFRHKRNIVRDELAVLDLLYSNMPERPLCFAGTCSTDYMKVYQKHLRLQGLVYCFNSTPTPPTIEGISGAVDTEKSYKLFMKALEFNSSGPITFDSDSYVSIIRVFMLATAKTLVEKGQKHKAEKLLDRLAYILPNQRVVFDAQQIYHAEIYANCGRPNKALSIVQQIVENYEAGKLYGLSEDYSALARMRKLAEIGKNQALLDRINKI